jgi:hypothetical protein
MPRFEGDVLRLGTAMEASDQAEKYWKQLILS